MVPVLWIVAALTAQERGFSVVLPELQYSRHCSSEITLHNPSLRFVDADVVGHKSTGALVPLLDRRTNRIRLRPSERIRTRLEVENDTAWAEVMELVPSPRLQPVLAISGLTECLDGNELLTTAREIVPPAANPDFTLDREDRSLKGMVLLVINASSRRAQWTACYSAGHTVSNGSGVMVPLCSQTLGRTLAPYQSSRLEVSVEGNPLTKFRAVGPAIAIQILAPSAPQVQMFKVESGIRFDEPGR